MKERKPAGTLWKGSMDAQALRGAWVRVNDTGEGQTEKGQEKVARPLFPPPFPTAVIC